MKNFCMKNFRYVPSSLGFSSLSFNSDQIMARCHPHPWDYFDANPRRGIISSVNISVGVSKRQGLLFKLKDIQHYSNVGAHSHNQSDCQCLCSLVCKGKPRRPWWRGAVVVHSLPFFWRCVSGYFQSPDEAMLAHPSKGVSSILILFYTFTYPEIWLPSLWLLTNQTVNTLRKVTDLIQLCAITVTQERSWHTIALTFLLIFYLFSLYKLE